MPGCASYRKRRCFSPATQCGFFRQLKNPFLVQRVQTLSSFGSHGMASLIFRQDRTCFCASGVNQVLGRRCELGLPPAAIRPLVATLNAS